MGIFIDEREFQAKYFMSIFYFVPSCVDQLLDTDIGIHHHFDGLVQACSHSNALAMELLQSCTKPSIYDKEKTNAVRISYLIESQCRFQIVC